MRRSSRRPTTDEAAPCIASQRDHRHITRPLAARLARAIVASIGLDDDPTTCAKWARGVGAGRGTLRAWSYANQEQPHNVLAFSRLCRAVYLAPLEGCRIDDLLDVVDRRVRASLLGRGGVSPGDRQVSFEEFLSRQQILSNTALLREVRALLQALPVDSSSRGSGRAG